MSFIDDWSQITLFQRTWLTEACLNPRCSHARMMHGQVNRSRSRGGIFLSLDASRCETCSCEWFRDLAPVNEDDVLAAHRLLKIEGTRLGDFGIPPYEQPAPKPETPPEDSWGGVT